MKKKTNQKYGSFWKCLSCEGHPEFEHKKMMDHLKDVHEIDPKTTKGNRQMLCHMDGRDWFSWDYEWEIGGIKAVQHTCQKRAKDDMMRWV